jgi:tRNA A-37 threonylcarbamoyl transferase component Bud32
MAGDRDSLGSDGDPTKPVERTEPKPLEPLPPPPPARKSAQMKTPSRPPGATSSSPGFNDFDEDFVIEPGQDVEDDDAPLTGSDTKLPTLTLSVLGRVGPGTGTFEPHFDDSGSISEPSVTAPSTGGGPGSEATTTERHHPDARRGARTGDVIGGRYIVEGQLGRGGMGRVLRVRHQVLGKAFALKLIKAPVAMDARMRELFYREARLASAMTHDNICSIVDFGEDPSFGLFMVMELLDGQTVHHKLRQGGRLPPKVACDVMWQVCEAVRYIHGRTILHGDIKTENIFLVRTSGNRRAVKLLDFGLARPDLRRGAGSVDGTPEYLAPERIEGAPATVATDIYALGIVLYELLVGKLPFTGGNVEEVFKKQRHEAVPQPSTKIDEPLDERADAIVERATAKNPADRHADVAGFMYELRTLMNMMGMDTVRRRPAAPDTGGAPKRRDLDHNKTKAAYEVFAYAPLPMAVTDVGGKVRAANPAFLEFLGIAGSAAGLELRDSGLGEVCPTLFDDLRNAAAGRRTIKRAIYLSEGGDATIEAALIITPAPSSAEVTAGELHLLLHPLRAIKGQ